MKNPSVFCIYAGMTRPVGACEIYRGNMPLYYLEKMLGWDTGWAFVQDIVEDMRRTDMQSLYQLVSQFDVFVFPRLYVQNDNVKQSLAVIYAIIRANGKRIVYETDDDYTNKHRIVCDGDAITPALWADALTVTTPYLAEIMRQHVKRPMYVLPNCVDPRVWRDNPLPKVEEFDDVVMVGLTGSITHSNDWKILQNVLPRALDENPNMQLLIMGYHPDYLKDLPRTHYANGAEYHLYAQMIRQLDVVLCPVDPQDGFNLGKSDIKAVEGMAGARIVNGNIAGAFPIATDNKVYQLSIKNGETGILVDHTETAWYNAIDSVVKDRSFRETVQNKAYQWAWSKRNIETRCKDWAKAYRAISRSPVNSITLPL